MDYSNLETPNRRADTSNLQSQLNILKQTLDEAKLKEKKLTDELNSTKTKLKLTESQLMHSPKWSPSQKLDSDIQFIKATHQAEIKEIKAQLDEKDRKISTLKQKLMTSSPEITSFLRFVIQSVQQFIQEGTANDQSELISELYKILEDFRSYLTQDSSIFNFFGTLKNYIETLVKFNIQLTVLVSDTSEKDKLRKQSNVMERQLQNMLSDLNAKQEQNKSLDQSIKRIKDQYNELRKQNENLKQQLVAQAKSYEAVSAKLGNASGYKSPSKGNYSFTDDLKRIDKLMQYKEENDNLKEIISDFAEKALGFHTIATLSKGSTVSKQVFQNVLSKISNYEKQLKQVSSIFQLDPLTIESIVPDVQSAYNAMKQEIDNNQDTSAQLAKITKDLNAQIQDLQQENLQKDQIIRKLKQSVDKNKQIMSQSEQEKNKILDNNNKISKEFVETSKKFQKQVTDLQNELEKSKQTIQKQSNKINTLNSMVETQKMRSDQNEQIISEIKQENKKLAKQNNDLTQQNRKLSINYNQNKTFTQKLNDEVVELTKFRAKTHSLQEDNTKLNEKIKKANDKITYLSSELQKSKEILDALVQKVQKNKQQITDLRNENKSLKTNSTQQTNEINIQSERYNNIVTELAETSKELKEAKEHNTELQQSIVEGRQKIESLQNTINIMQTQYTSASKKINKLEANNKEISNSQQEAQQRELSLKADLNQAQSEIQRLTSEYNALNDRLKSQTEELLQLHESDVSGKIAKEELRSTKEQLSNLKKELDQKNSALDDLNHNIANQLSENQNLRQEIDQITNENEQLREAIDQRDTFLTNLKDKRKESKLLKKALKDSENKLSSASEEINKLSKDLSTVKNQYNQDMRTMQKEIQDLTKQNDSKSQKIVELKIQLTNSTEENKYNTRMSKEDKQAIEKLTQELTVLRDTTIKKKLYEDLQDKMKKLQRENLELSAQVSERDATIVVSNQRSKDLDDIRSLYNNEHSSLLQIKSLVQSIHKYFRTTRNMTIKDAYQKLQSLFDFFSLTTIDSSLLFTPNRYRICQGRSYDIGTTEEGELFTERHMSLLMQIIETLEKFQIVTISLRKQMPLYNRIALVSSAINEVLSHYEYLEKDKNRLESIVKKQHSALCTATKETRSPMSSPSKFNY